MVDINNNKISLALFEGGGVKGNIHLEKLKIMEQITGKPICEIFDFTGGTSVGGLISILLNLPNPNNPGKPLFSAEQAQELFEEMAHDIFPVGLTFRKLWSFNGLFSHKFSPEPLVKLLKEYCKDYTLKDLIGDVVVTGYDLNNKQNPLITFSTIDARQSEENNYYISDIIQGITAAPGYFPSHNFRNITNTKSHKIIDGGIYANDPTLQTWKLLKENNYHIDNALYLSLKEEDNDDYQTVCCGGGMLELVKNNMPGKILEATQQADEKTAQSIFGNKLIEIATYIPEKHAEMSNSSTENLQALKEFAKKSIYGSSTFRNAPYNEKFKEAIDKIINHYNANNPNDQIVMNNFYKELFHINTSNNALDKSFEKEEDIANNEDTVNTPIAQALDSKDIEPGKKELLAGIKEFFNPFIEKNPEAKADIENFLHEIKNLTLAEIEKGIVSFKEASLKWQAEQNNLDVFSSCSMEALKEDMTLEGEEHTDDIPGYF
ncbi:patatin [Rickettsia conorii subsp. heilongjiangensis]|uniref:Patatin n=1 Tax=Rickettsia conorii subsp. heilongjiangensis TaxID=226665 RepID=A0AAD1GIV5_RICCR|nr:patatin-like phospholipase family protein [Rickettsia conorii]AEK74922.1 Patatin-like phospholipase [Rickettsia conorii subsp. heilongjiangensis 054]BBM91662.1 patatin [Rickettsia conorii subsp. heilongjiangensis]BBM92870.1 patatin [Rickettsia conorii subsp. heilongjiangensis]BBM94079.1 patatin [Rickettsia conorii subsp. heilongjiangensis]BBM95288.1 patatin [Rickettsia conorii subsp. heilongjiangensis]